MDKTTLVNVDLEKGLEIVRALENGSLKIGVALWLYATEYEEWRLFIAARALDELKPRGAYRYLRELLVAAGLPPEDTPPIVILPMARPFIKGQDVRENQERRRDAPPPANDWRSLRRGRLRVSNFIG